MMKHVILVAGLLAGAVLPANAQEPSKQPTHLYLTVPCGGYDIWYQDGAVWGSHGVCGGFSVFEAGLIARMGGRKYIIETATYPDGTLVTTRFTMPVDGQGEYDTYSTDGKSPPTHGHGTYTVG